MKKLTTKASLLLTSLYLSTFGLTLAAEPTNPNNDPYSVQMLTNKVTAKDILINTIGWVLNFAGAIAVLFIIYGGILYVTSNGSDKRVESARKTLTNAVIGLIVVILAKVIVSFVTRTAFDVLNFVPAAN